MHESYVFLCFLFRYFLSYYLFIYFIQVLLPKDKRQVAASKKMLGLLARQLLYAPIPCMLPIMETCQQFKKHQYIFLFFQLIIGVLNEENFKINITHSFWQKNIFEYLMEFFTGVSTNISPDADIKLYKIHVHFFL